MDIVMPLCRMHSSLQSDKSPRREILLHALRTKRFFVRPDAAGMEEAIGKFLDGLEGQDSQERRGFQEMHRFVATHPVPTPQESKGMTHPAALEGKFLSDLDKELRKVIYVYTCIYCHVVYLYILTVYTCIYCDIRLM